MSPRCDLTGAHVLLVTPFDTAGEIDTQSLADHIDFLLVSGVDGIVGLGTTGEFFSLSLDERAALMSTIAKLVRGRVALTFGVGDSSTRVAVELARHAQVVGADVVMLQSPYYFNHTTAACDTHFLAVADAVDIPIMVYDGAGGIAVSVERLGALHRKRPSIAYVKLSIPDPTKIAAVVTDIPGIRPLCGDEYLLVLGLRLGAVGSTVGIGNVLPEAMVSLHRAVESGDIQRARAIQIAKISPLVAVCTNEKASYIRCFKEILAHRGIIASPMTRLPLGPLDHLRREEVLATAEAVATA